MPLYEFICQKCGNEFEKVVSFSATHPPACPSCESDEVERQMGVPAIHFKGSGWYINDSKKSEKKNGAKASDEGATKNADSGKSESKESGSEKKESKSESKKEVAKPAAKKD